MKKILSIILIVVSNTLWLFAQPSIQWQKCLGGSSEDIARSVQQTTDGGYIVASETNSNDGDVSGNHGIVDFWIVKLNSSGIIQWQKCLGDSSFEYPYSIKQATDGGYIVAGSTNSHSGDVSGNHGETDFWVVKLSSSGVLQWQKCMGGTWGEIAYSIQQTTDGGFIVAGSASSHDGDVIGIHGTNWNDYWVVKIDSIGNIQWQKCLGGAGKDVAKSIHQTNDGGYIIIGSTNSIDGDVIGGTCGNCYSPWIVKLNSTGVIEWQKLFSTCAIDANSIQQTSDGGYIFVANSHCNGAGVSGNHGGNDFWVVKIESTGNIQWQKCLGGTADDNVSTIRQVTDGGYIVAGRSLSNDGDVYNNHGGFDSWIVKLNGSGTIQWQKCIGGSSAEWLSSIEQTTDGGFIVAGQTASNDGDVIMSHGGYEAWIVKLSSGIGIDEITNPISNLQITPNPLSHSTTISFSLSQSENLSVGIYDITGRLVENLFDGRLNSGSHEIKWDVSGEDRIDDGVYLINFTGNTFSQSSKLVVVK